MVSFVWTYPARWKSSLFLSRATSLTLDCTEGPGETSSLSLAPFTGARGQNVHVLQLRGEPFAKFPRLMETRCKLESKFWATEARLGCLLGGISEFRKHNPLSSSSPCPTSPSQNPVSVRGIAFPCAVAQIMFFFFSFVIATWFVAKVMFGCHKL